MPEGPEIIITTQFLKLKLINAKITSINILSGRYTHQDLKGLNYLKNNYFIIKNIDSKGKFIWFDLEDKNGNNFYLMNTLGMTGSWSFQDSNNIRLKFNIKANNNKKYSLYFIDQRNFGTLEFIRNSDKLDKKLNKLAPDVLKSNMTIKELKEHIKAYIKKTRKNLNLVKILMDQEAIVSGIGNYLVAEILYDAKLSPHRKLDELNDKEINKLVKSIRTIAKSAYYNNSIGYMINFEEFLKKHSKLVDNNKLPDYFPDIKIKSKFKFKVYRQKKDPYNNEVKKEQIVKGRTIHWVSKIQT